MAKVHILIIEDEAENANLLQETLQELDYQVSVATNLQDALGVFYATMPDLVIIDIYLDGTKDGIVFARKMNQNEVTKRPFIFLTSSFDKNTFAEAKETLPYHYLLKPFNPLELSYAIELTLEKFAGETGLLDLGNAIAVNDVFFIKRQDALVKVDPGDLDYIKVEDRYCELWKGEDKFLIHSSLKDMMQRLPAQSRFIRIHRNYLVNFDRIKSIVASDGIVLLHNSKELLLSRRYLDEIKKNFPVLF